MNIKIRDNKLKGSQKFRLKFYMNTSVEMKNGKISYVSCRFVSKIKKILGKR